MDVAHKRFLEIKDELFALPISEHSEADTRADVIDRMLREVLGWRPGQISREDTEGGERYDYKLAATTEHAVVEAKRAGLVFDLPESEHRWYKRSGVVCKAEPLKSAIDQVEKYAQRFGCGLACASTGRQWVVFLGSRLDGRSRDEGFVAVFRNLEELTQPGVFMLFHRMLAETSVRSGAFRLPFLEHEGLPRPVARAGRRLADQRGGRQKKRSELAKAIEPVLREVFAGLSSAQNAEALRACFVETDQSREANTRLDRIARELTEDIEPQLTGDQE